MKYGVIVVGAGSAGCVLAARLSEDPGRSVLLLEAGPDYPDLEHLPDDLKYGDTRTAEAKGAPHNWSLTGIINDTQGQIHVAQGKVVGGSSAINGQVMVRGLPEDYEAWAAAGNTEWSYLKVLPYFRKMETDMDIRDDFHGTDGPIPVMRREKEPWPTIQEAFYKACVAVGFKPNPDLNGPEAGGVGALPMNNPDTVRRSVAMTHLSEARHRLNMTVRANVLARRVIFEGMKAVGVEAESGGEVFAVYGEQIILSTGALKSPHLLMLSGVGPAEQLKKFNIPLVRHMPGVGRVLKNHPIAGVSVRVKDGVPLIPDNRGIRAALRYTAEGSKLANDMMMMTNSVYSPLSGDELPKQTIRISLALEGPASEGYLQLASADPRVQPQFNYNYLSDSADRERLRDAVHLALKLLKQDAYKGIIEEVVSPAPKDLASDEALDNWLLRTVGTSRHVSMTCRMGPASDPNAVVDQYCRVHGLQNLRVVDGSALPMLTRANTNATIIVMGERVADWMKAERV